MILESIFKNASILNLFSDILKQIGCIWYFGFNKIVQIFKVWKKNKN